MTTTTPDETSSDGLVPPDNLQAYSLFYRIEVGLRELILRKISERIGPLWWKDRLPGDVLESFKRAKSYERGIRWVQLIPHHPIHYLDFPDLKKVIQRKDNWNDVFKPIFGREDILSSLLSEIEPIRNKVAHNRRVSTGDIVVLRGVLQAIETAVGLAAWRELFRPEDLTASIPSTMTQLLLEANSSLESCLACDRLPFRSVWNQVKQQWWFDEAYLDEDCAPITKFFGLLDVYDRLPRNRGSGHSLERWLKEQQIKDAHDGAVRVLEGLTEP